MCIRDSLYTEKSKQLLWDRGCETGFIQYRICKNNGEMYIEKTLLHKFRLKTYIPEHKLTFLSSLVYADKKIYAECLDIENRAQIVYQIEESSGKWKPIISEYLPNLELEPLTQFSIKDNKVYYLHENKILLKNLLDMDESTIYAGSDIKQMELCGDYIVYSLHEGEKYLLKKFLLDGSCL